MCLIVNEIPQFQGPLDMGGESHTTIKAANLTSGWDFLAKKFKFWEVLMKLFKWEKYKRMKLFYEMKKFLYIPHEISLIWQKRAQPLPAVDAPQ